MADMCSSCFKPLPPNAVSCPDCFNNQPHDYQKGYTWACKQCGKQNQPNRNHCWHCGSKEDGTPSDKPEQFLLPHEQVQIGDNLVSGRDVAVQTATAAPSVCYRCSSSLDADARFCPSCRAPVARTLNCPSCGKSVSADGKFCKYCSADLKPKPEPPLNDGFTYSPRIDYSHRDSFRSSPKEKAEKIAVAGGITMVVSVIAFFWGTSYTSSFANTARAGLASLAGQSDSTYAFAQLCQFLGVIGFIIGLVLLIVGLAQRSDT